MRGKAILKHGLLILTGVFLTLGLPFIRTDYFSALVSGVDAVTSASVILDQPSGEYVILINRALHSDAENLEDWITFFEGGDILYIFEDIACSVAKGDSGGEDMAKSFQSRLPENQMSLQTEDATLLMSRADCGKFDIIILSKEYAEAYQASTAYGENVEVIEITGGDAS